LTQAKTWFAQGHPKFTMCVNLCARELGCPTTLELIDRELHRAGLVANDLTVELTEQELFESKAAGMKVLQGLSERGVAIALDDFGTGYSSLGYLTNLPVNLIKLHTSFADQLLHDARIKKVVGAIIDLAHALDLEVVAEGVEHEIQFETLRAMQCDAVQGYFVSRPLPPRQMDKWLSLHAQRAGQRSMS
jgi:EAL domain-containing protein (putative c-di-GMP-specific phosphodiesterase class I)